MRRLLGKVAIVTGAGSRFNEVVGVGQATAIKFADEGAKVLIVDKNLKAAKKTKSIIESSGGICEIFQGDVSNEKICKSLVFEAVNIFEKIDILMNNVAVSGPGMVTEVEEKLWTNVMDTNLKSMVFVSKYAIPEMRKNGSGSIINVSSVDGIRAGQTKNIPYTASKGGVISITRAMAVHHGRQNIRVNCIAPGLLHAPFSLNNSDKFRELRRKASPLGIEGVAEDIAWASVYLASDEARWVSGVVLPVDGGLLAASPISVVDNLIS